MLDTLMVLWTKGICSRFLQTFLTFLLLFVSICVMLFLITASGVRWPGLAITSALPGAAASPAMSTITPARAVVPIIMQNPTPRATPAATPTSHPEHPRSATPAPASTWAPARPTPTPTPDYQSFFP